MTAVYRAYGVHGRVQDPWGLDFGVYENGIIALRIMRTDLLVLNIPQSTHHGLMYGIYIQAVTLTTSKIKLVVLGIRCRS